MVGIQSNNLLSLAMKYLHVLLRASFALAAVLSAPFNHKARDVSQCTDGNKRTRMEWSSMADADRLSFVHAIRCLMDAPPSATVAKVTSRYDELVLIHSSLSDIVHQGPMFLPWHRYFVHGFEALLRDECGYKAPLPWWHEIKDSGNFGASSMFTGEYFGSLPENTAPADQQTMDICVTDGVGDFLPPLYLFRCITERTVASRDSRTAQL
jgi:tyrosinase